MNELHSYYRYYYYYYYYCISLSFSVNYYIIFIITIKHHFTHYYYYYYYITIIIIITSLSLLSNIFSITCGSGGLRGTAQELTHGTNELVAPIASNSDYHLYKEWSNGTATSDLQGSFDQLNYILIIIITTIEYIHNCPST